jgi:hypothetical protein
MGQQRHKMVPKPGWWRASDGKLYPAHQHPNYRPPPPPTASKEDERMTLQGTSEWRSMTMRLLTAPCQRFVEDLTVVTCDTGQSSREKAAGLKVNKLTGETGEEPGA